MTTNFLSLEPYKSKHYDLTEPYFSKVQFCRHPDTIDTQITFMQINLCWILMLFFFWQLFELVWTVCFHSEISWPCVLESNMQNPSPSSKSGQKLNLAPRKWGVYVSFSRNDPICLCVELNCDIFVFLTLFKYSLSCVAMTRNLLIDRLSYSTYLRHRSIKLGEFLSFSASVFLYGKF